MPYNNLIEDNIHKTYIKTNSEVAKPVYNSTYLNRLLQEYERASGISSIDPDTIASNRGFWKWIYRRKNTGLGYTSWLEDNGLYSDSPFVAEVGKGALDSIVNYSDSESTIITPYTEGLRKNKDKIIKAGFEVVSGCPIIEGTNKANGAIIRLIRPEEAKTFMTQNPDINININSWSQLHNNCNNFIIVGAYGNISDRDKDFKITELVALKNLLINYPFIESYSKVGDSYYYIIATDRTAKVQKVKSRNKLSEQDRYK